MRLEFLLAVVLGSQMFWPALLAQENGVQFPLARQALEEGLAANAFPGCSVAVGTETNLLWCEGLGYFDYERKRRVSCDTIYDLASVTKVAATTATYMRLVALGKVRVSDPVAKYLPEFITSASTEAEQEQRRRITVEHLLTHSSGLTSWKPFYREVQGYRAMVNAILAVPLESPPGERFRYSDPGMLLLGEIAARAGGKPFPELAQDLVFRPLRMKDTMHNPPRRLHRRIPPTERWPGTNTFVHGVVHDENARAAEGITGHAGLFSTAGDLARLSQEILRGVEGRSRLFPRDVVNEFVRNRNMTPNASRGLGWDVGESKWPDGSKTRYIAHNGFTGTYLRIDLDRKVFVVLLSNRCHPTRDNDRLGRVRGKFLEAVWQDLPVSDSVAR